MAQSLNNYGYDEYIRQLNWNQRDIDYKYRKINLHNALNVATLNLNSFNVYQNLLDRNNRDEPIYWVEKNNSNSINDKVIKKRLISEVGYEINLNNKSITKGVNQFKSYKQWISQFENEIKTTLLTPFKVVEKIYEIYQID
ncbi:hypothetical protein CJJ23_03320 [Mycoplasmopsis agassizii]|uniref:Uncharacterized protein n=2 Tax=Mycoplasmopsis agassizii TaxID=33922 RepID=A0A269TKC4_9BACT|nr:hypothetical protein CJJ23_03320 [Mycoplasmopsis agassizii]